MRENNLYPFGGDPVRKLNRNPGTGKGMKTGMGMRMYATGERNKLRADALTSRRTVFPIAHVRTQLPPSPETFDSTSLFPPAPFPRNFPPLSPRSLTLSSRRDEHGNRLNNAPLFNNKQLPFRIVFRAPRIRLVSCINAAHVIEIEDRAASREWTLPGVAGRVCTDRFRGGLRSKERFQFCWISCCAGQPKCHSSGGCGRAARNTRVSFLYFVLYCFSFFFFFKVSRINRWIFIFRSFVSRFARTNVNTIGKFFFFFEGWLFEREKNTRFARFWNISDVSDEGYFFDMNKNWIYRWNGLLCKIEAWKMFLRLRDCEFLDSRKSNIGIVCNNCVVLFKNFEKLLLYYIRSYVSLHYNI